MKNPEQLRHSSFHEVFGMLVSIYLSYVGHIRSRWRAADGELVINVNEEDIRRIKRGVKLWRKRYKKDGVANIEIDLTNGLRIWSYESDGRLFISTLRGIPTPLRYHIWEWGADGKWRATYGAQYCDRYIGELLFGKK